MVVTRPLVTSHTTREPVVDQLLQCSSEYFPPLHQMAPDSESGFVLWGWK